jgi:membrane associated rhomboid family serine protease
MLNRIIKIDIDTWKYFLLYICTIFNWNMDVAKKKKYLPWVVWYIVITAIAQYILINFKELFTFIDTEVFILKLAPNSVNIYNGQYWGVLTNNFLHVYLSQLILNIVGIIIFGYFIEKRIGFIKFSMMVIVGSIIPSIIQLNLANEPGIGLSGVNFTLFGYILAKSFFYENFKVKYIGIYLTIMISIIVSCNIYNLYVDDVYRTEAMAFGLILGLIIGFTSGWKKWLQYPMLFIIMSISIFTLFYAPWSAEWLVYKGVVAHESKKYKIAKTYYLKALNLDSKNKQAIENLELLKLDDLKWKAYKAHIKEDYLKAKEYYREILKIDPKDEWAKQGYSELK